MQGMTINVCGNALPVCQCVTCIGIFTVRRSIVIGGVFFVFYAHFLTVDTPQVNSMTYLSSFRVCCLFPGKPLVCISRLTHGLRRLPQVAEPLASLLVSV